MAASFRGVCDVCSLVDGDATEKDVICCGMCSAHLCRADAARTPTVLGRRARAWVTRGMRGLGKRECK